MKIVPIFLLGKTPDAAIGKGRAKQDAATNEILRKYSLSTESKLLIRNDKEILGINIHGLDGLVVFPCCLDRFGSLIYLAETGKPIVIVSGEATFSNALETYQYLADKKNVELAFSPQQVKAKIKALRSLRLLETMKVCLLGAGDWKLDGIAWERNPLFSGKLNAENVNVEEFVEAVEKTSLSEAEVLAREWVRGVKVLEPSLDDVAKAARVYLAMKKTLKAMKANALYVLWCGQFAKKLDAKKMCFALAKLADDGYPTGCWRGESLLPLLILHSVSNKPVFVSEAFTHKGDTITLRHCFAPTKLADGEYILRRWRNMEGTVTGYCQLPEGQVTLVNCGIGDHMIVAKGKVIDCKDLGGENCRMTVWVQMEKPQLIERFVAREFAVVYGDYGKEVTEVAERLGLRVLR